jgi:hypothetical protein
MVVLSQDQFLKEWPLCERCKSQLRPRALTSLNKLILVSVKKSSLGPSRGSQDANIVNSQLWDEKSHLRLASIVNNINKSCSDSTKYGLGLDLDIFERLKVSTWSRSRSELTLFYF